MTKKQYYLMLLLLWLLQACGQIGPLYLPAEQAPVAAPKPEEKPK